MALRVWTGNVFFSSSSMCTRNVMFGICFKICSSQKGRQRGDRTVGETGTAGSWWLWKLVASLRATVTLSLCGLLWRLEIFTVRVNKQKTNNQTFVPHVQANMTGTQVHLTTVPLQFDAG